MQNKFFHFYFAIGGIILIFYFLFNINSLTIYTKEYYFLCGGLTIALILYSYVMHHSKKIDFFHPYHIFFVFYICIFFITPLILINEQRTTCVGKDIMGGCIPGTIFTILALFSYSIGYVHTKNKNNHLKALSISKANPKRILLHTYLLLSILLVISLAIIASSGKSLSYILTLGQGTYKVQEQNILSTAGFLNNLLFCLLVPWFILCIYEKKKWILFFFTYLILAIYFSFGFRFITYIMIIGFSIIYFRKRNKTPSIKYIIIMICSLLMFSVILGNVRDSMRVGEKQNFNGFNESNIAYTLESNFNIYQTYYGVIDKYFHDTSDEFHFYYGRITIIDPISIWIPRLLWPEKPTTAPLGESMAKCISPDVIYKVMMSSPNLTEYYLDFGIIGIIFFSYLIGFISKKMLSFYNSDSVLKIIFYSLYCGFMIQVINRGYTAMLGTLFVFLIIPLFTYKKYFKQ